MEPALPAGVLILANQCAYELSLPERGDLVLYRSLDEREDYFVKRVVGLPGEEIEISGGIIVIDGVPIVESESVTRPSYSGIWVMKANEYFVLGDNRDFSNDSHEWGGLPAANILGRVGWIYWPPRNWGRVTDS